VIKKLQYRRGQGSNMGCRATGKINIKYIFICFAKFSYEVMPQVEFRISAVALTYISFKHFWLETAVPGTDAMNQESHYLHRRLSDCRECSLLSAV
jgi:hypothetical protein